MFGRRASIDPNFLQARAARGDPRAAGADGRLVGSTSVTENETHYSNDAIDVTVKDGKVSFKNGKGVDRDADDVVGQHGPAHAGGGSLAKDNLAGRGLYAAAAGDYSTAAFLKAKAAGEEFKGVVKIPFCNRCQTKGHKALECPTGYVAFAPHKCGKNVSLSKGDSRTAVGAHGHGKEHCVVADRKMALDQWVGVQVKAGKNMFIALVDDLFSSRGILCGGKSGSNCGHSYAYDCQYGMVFWNDEPILDHLPATQVGDIVWMKVSTKQPPPSLQQALAAAGEKVEAQRAKVNALREAGAGGECLLYEQRLLKSALAENESALEDAMREMDLEEAEEAREAAEAEAEAAAAAADRPGAKEEADFEAFGQAAIASSLDLNTADAQRGAGLDPELLSKPRPIPSDLNETGYRGVYRNGAGYQAIFSDGHGQRIDLGLFDTAELAGATFSRATTTPGGLQEVLAENKALRAREWEAVAAAGVSAPTLAEVQKERGDAALNGDGSQVEGGPLRCITMHHQTCTFVDGSTKPGVPNRGMSVLLDEVVLPPALQTCDLFLAASLYWDSEVFIHWDKSTALESETRLRLAAEEKARLDEREERFRVSRAEAQAGRAAVEEKVSSAGFCIKLQRPFLWDKIACKLTLDPLNPAHAGNPTAPCTVSSDFSAVTGINNFRPALGTALTGHPKKNRSPQGSSSGNSQPPCYSWRFQVRDFANAAVGLALREANQEKSLGGDSKSWVITGDRSLASTGFNVRLVTVPDGCVLSLYWDAANGTLAADVDGHAITANGAPLFDNLPKGLRQEDGELASCLPAAACNSLKASIAILPTPSRVDRAGASAVTDEDLAALVGSERAPPTLSELRETYALLDQDGDGSLDPQEFASYLRARGVTDWEKQAEFRKLANAASGGSTQDGESGLQVSFDEFASLLLGEDHYIPVQVTMDCDITDDGLVHFKYGQL